MLPTKLPSISMSAPNGSDEISAVVSLKLAAALPGLWAAVLTSEIPAGDGGSIYNQVSSLIWMVLQVTTQRTHRKVVDVRLGCYVAPPK